MPDHLTRRDAIKRLGSAGAAVALGGTIRGQTTPIRVAGMPVEIAVAAISPSTVRITVAAVVGTGGVPDDGALVAAAEGRVMARRRTSPIGAVSAGNFIVTFTDDPPALHVAARGGRAIQRFTPTIDALVTPDVDESLDEQPAKTRFWNAFKALGPWWAEQPPY